MTKNFFEVRFEFYSPLAFQRAIACLCTSNRTLNVTKHFFVVYTHFPHRLEHHQRFSLFTSESSTTCQIFLNSRGERSKRFEFILKAPAKALEIWGFWGVQFSGCKTFHPVNSLFQRPWFTSLICLILGYNIAFFSLSCAFLVIFSARDEIAVIIGNSGISSRCNMKRDAGTAEFGRSMELSWSDEKYSQFQGVPWMV